MGEDFKVDPNAMRATARALHDSASEVESHGKALGAKTGGRSVAKGKFAFVETAVKRGIKIAEHDITQAVKKFFKGDAAGLEKAAAETERRDVEAKSTFDGLAQHPHVSTHARPIVASSRRPSGGSEPRVVRQDPNFRAPTNERGVPKSQLSEDGSMTPANPNGRTTPLQHVMGMDPVKGDSSYTSFLTEGPGAKSYGPKQVQLDVHRLKADAASGKLSGVSVMTPKEVQATIRGDIKRIANIDVDRAIAKGPEGVKSLPELDQGA
jgi:hypothetical protein